MLECFLNDVDLIEICDWFQVIELVICEEGVECV